MALIIDHLASGTQYSCRPFTYRTSAADRKEGWQVTLSTLPAGHTGRPLVKTMPVIDAFSNGAQLEAIVSPNGLRTTVHFEACATTFPAFSDTAGQDIGALGTNYRRQDSVVGLPPGSSYQFRAVGANSAGRTEGECLWFTTVKAPK